MSTEPGEESVKDVMDRMEAMTISFLDQIGAHINEAKGGEPMSNEEDRDVRSMAEHTADERFPEMVLAPENEQRAEDFSEGYVAGYAAGFHRTPAPKPDVQALIHEARILGEREWQAHWPGRAQRALSRLADALETAVSTPQDTMTFRNDARFEHSDHQAAEMNLREMTLRAHRFREQLEAAEKVIADALDAGDHTGYSHHKEPVMRILSAYTKGTD